MRNDTEVFKGKAHSDLVCQICVLILSDLKLVPSYSKKKLITYSEEFDISKLA